MTQHKFITFNDFKCETQTTDTDIESLENIQGSIYKGSVTYVANSVLSPSFGFGFLSILCVMKP